MGQKPEQMATASIGLGNSSGMDQNVRHKNTSFSKFPSCAVHIPMSSHPNAVVKEGFIQRYKSGFLSSKWKSNYAILYPDSTLAIFNDRGDSRPAESIFLRNVVPYICIGLMTDRMPVRRPSLPPGTAVQRLVGIGMDPQASKVHWLLFPSEQVLEEWFNAILTTLPKPQNPQPTQPPPAAFPSGQQQQGGFVPPAKYPDAPPPYGAPQAQQNVGYAGGPSPQQPPYGYASSQQPQPQYPQQQTVVIDRTGTGYGRGGGTSSFGTGLAAGVGGAMLGSLLGYGIGSMFAPHGGWGGWGGWSGPGYGYGGGMGGGFGGGYIQDNDTYVTNNYYINNDGDNTNNPAQNDSTDYSEPVQNNDYTDYTEPVQNDYADDYDGAGGTWDDGGGDYGGGFDDGGGYDGGGGDW